MVSKPSGTGPAKFGGIAKGEKRGKPTLWADQPAPWSFDVLKFMAQRRCLVWGRSRIEAWLAKYVHVSQNASLSLKTERLSSKNPGPWEAALPKLMRVLLGSPFTVEAYELPRLSRTGGRKNEPWFAERRRLKPRECEKTNFNAYVH